MKPHVCAKMQDGDEWVQNEAGLPYRVGRM